MPTGDYIILIANTNPQQYILAVTNTNPLTYTTTTDVQLAMGFPQSVANSKAAGSKGALVVGTRPKP